MNGNRDWTVLFIGGASGTGKSSIARTLARHYEVNILEVDDISGALKAMTTAETLPVLHYFDTGVNWMDIGVSGNVKWLINVGGELAPGLRAIVDDHLETGVPVIIEGDFISPQLAASFEGPQVKALFVQEADAGQLAENYLAREGGELQTYRADVSAAYGAWLAGACQRLGLPLLESRPWATALERAVACTK